MLGLHWSAKSRAPKLYKNKSTTVTDIFFVIGVIFPIFMRQDTNIRRLAGYNNEERSFRTVLDLPLQGRFL